MNFQKPKSYVPTLSLIGGTIAGAMLSRIGYHMLPKAEKSNTETLYKGAIAALTGAGATFVDGNDAVSNLVRGTLIGASVEQGLSLVKQIAQDSKVENELVKQAVGLACPCQERTLGNPLQAGRIIPLRPTTGDFNPYQNSTYSNPYDELEQALDLEQARKYNKEAQESLANTTTI